MTEAATESPDIWQRFKRYAKERADGWMNPWTGQGTGRDKTTAGRFEPDLPGTPVMWISLYEGDPIAARICDMPPREMMRQGFSLERDDEADDEAEEGTETKDVEKALADLCAGQRIEEGMAWGRCTGGALLLIGVDDGLDATMPLQPERVRALRFLKVYDRSRISIERRYQDPKHPSLGEPEIYRINSVEGGSSAVVHESRFIRFGGARTSDLSRRANDSWDHSILKKVYDAIRRYHADHASASHMMTDASQGVWKMAGFLDSLTSGQSTKLFDRLQATEMGRGIVRAIVLDSDPKYGESFEKIATQFGGLSDMLDAAGNYLSAAVGYPVTVLLGRSPAGLNATGESDIRLFYDQMKTDRKQIVEPAIMRLVEVLTKGKSDGWRVCFPSFWQESPKEKAEREKAEADRDGIYIDKDVLTPEEVALAPHLEEVYPSLDRELRQEELDARKGEDTAPSNGPGLALTPTDQATIATVNQGLASMGLPPLPPPDGELTIAAFKAKYATTVAAAAAAEAGTDPSAEPPVPSGTVPGGTA